MTFELNLREVLLDFGEQDHRWAAAEGDVVIRNRESIFEGYGTLTDILKQPDLFPNEMEGDDVPSTGLTSEPESEADGILPALITPSRFARVWEQMDRFSIRLISVEFSGSGDSGDIDSVDILYMDKWLQPHTGAVSLKELVRELSDELICADDFPDWYNSEGGYGTLEWTLVGKTIEVEVNEAYTCYTRSSRSYDSNGIKVA